MIVAAVRGPAAVNMTEAGVGYRNVVDERGANRWTPPATPADEARQSQLTLVGNAADGWRRARADAGRTLDALLCTPPKLRAARGEDKGCCSCLVSDRADEEHSCLFHHTATSRVTGDRRDPAG